MLRDTSISHCRRAHAVVSQGQACLHEPRVRGDMRHAAGRDPRADAGLSDVHTISGLGEKDKCSRYCNCALQGYAGTVQFAIRAPPHVGIPSLRRRPMGTVGWLPLRVSSAM